MPMWYRDAKRRTLLPFEISRLCQNKVSVCSLDFDPASNASEGMDD